MLAAPRLPALLTLALLATGCCCPQLSGRYCHPASDPCSPEDTSACCPDATAHHCCGHRGRGLSSLVAFLGIGGAGVSSDQGPDYISPQPKFHPVPTHPVFEPQLASAPLQSIEPAENNPL